MIKVRNVKKEMTLLKCSFQVYASHALAMAK